MLFHHMCRRTCHLCYVQKTRAPTTETRLPLRYPLSPCWMVPPRLRFGPTAGADAPSVPPSRLPSAGVVHDNPDPCLTNISEARRKDLGISSASSRGIIFCITATNVKVLSLLSYRLLSQKKRCGRGGPLGSQATSRGDDRALRICRERLGLCPCGRHRAPRGAGVRCCARCAPSGRVGGTAGEKPGQGRWPTPDLKGAAGCAPGRFWYGPNRSQSPETRQLSPASCKKTGSKRRNDRVPTKDRGREAVDEGQARRGKLKLMP